MLPDTLIVEGDVFSYSYHWMVIAGCIFGFFSAWGIGANDVANAFATSVGGKAITVMQAVMIAAVFEFGGAVLLGSSVTDTVRKGIVDYTHFEEHPDQLMIGMLCVIISVGIWLLLATMAELPVSTTHSCVGGVVGFALCTQGGADAVNWSKIGLIVFSWFASPVLSGIFSSLLYLFVRKSILRTGNSFERSLNFFPVLIALTIAINAFFIMYKGGKGLGWHKTELYIGIPVCIGVGIACGLIAAITLIPYIRRKLIDVSDKPVTYEEDVAAAGGNAGAPIVEGDVELAIKDKEQKGSTIAPDGNASGFKAQLNVQRSLAEDETVQAIHKNSERFPERTEKSFSYLQVFTAIFDSFSHGANDVANSIGPLAAIVAIYNSAGNIEKKAPVEFWVLGLGGIGIVVGLATYGYKMLGALGVKLTKITPSRGFSIELGAAFVIVTGSYLGIPLSTTHCQVGATLGVGMLDGWRKAINWKMMGKVIFGWVITLCVTGSLSALLFSFAIYSPSAAPGPISFANCNASFPGEF